MHYDSVGFLDYLLENPYNFEWSVQGLGMLRLYLNKRDRLSIWHNAGRLKDATPIHDHYWGFQSWIFCGELRNTRYVGATLEEPFGEPYNRFRIQTGENPENAIIEGPVPDFLRECPTEIYHAGDTYKQEAIECHQTEFVDGTITLIRRLSYLDKLDEANVWGPVGVDFVSAEPRLASDEEIGMFVEAAKKELDKVRQY